MTGRDESGRFLPGNRFWEARSSAGCKPKFANPEDLWAACVEYFDWIADNPLTEVKVASNKGEPEHQYIPKMRAMTLDGLCMFLDITRETWREWRSSRPDLSDVIARAESVIRRQKFEGAAADLLNANIIARDLGLADRNEHTGADGGPIKTESEPTPKELARQVAFLLAQGIQEADDGE